MPHNQSIDVWKPLGPGGGQRSEDGKAEGERLNGLHFDVGGGRFPVKFVKVC